MSSPGEPGPRPADVDTDVDTDVDVTDPWSASLDEAGPGGPAGPVGAAAGSASARRRAALAVLAVVALLFAVTWLPGVRPEQEEPAPAVAGAGLAVPVSLRLPLGAVTTADRSYVGLRLYDGPGGVLVTVPTQVVQPSGLRTELPENPAAWLVDHPKLFVSRVRPVNVAGRAATQVDYRVSREAAGTRQSFSVALFCGWKREVDASGIAGLPACTRVSAGARVRATLVPVGGRTVVIEAVWPADASPNGRMPRALGLSYRALLAGVTAAA
jgi:hypothetical protein